MIKSSATAKATHTHTAQSVIDSDSNICVAFIDSNQTIVAIYFCRLGFFAALLMDFAVVVETFPNAFPQVHIVTYCISISI